jgi:hypothetical protein
MGRLLIMRIGGLIRRRGCSKKERWLNRWRGGFIRERGGSI